MIDTCDWGNGNAPFRDELLSSWSNRIRSRHKLRPDRPDMPLQMDYRGRKRSWASASANPTDQWLKQAAARTGQPMDALASLALSRSRPGIPWHWYSWSDAPIRLGIIPNRNPSLLWSWCSRCLAEDYAAGRSAYIRRDWVLAYSTYCRIHLWPLTSHCQLCGSGSWSFSTLTGEPTRMQCANCSRYLERSEPSVFHDGDRPSKISLELMAIESEIAKALRGKVPDQFRFNFTSSEQLLREFVDFPRLLSKTYYFRWLKHRPIEFGYGSTFPILSHDSRSFDPPFALSVARKSMARRLLVATSLIIGGIDKEAIFGGDSPDSDGAKRLLYMSELPGVSEIRKCKRYWSPDVRERFTELLQPHKRNRR
jgi:hypothetical protein